MSHIINEEAKNFATNTTSMRLRFLLFAVVVWLGIYLTGFSNVHWFMYVPAAALAFAAITGICPTQIAIIKMLGAK